MIAELSLEETILVELLKALFTAIFVAGGAALVVANYRGRAEAFQSELETTRAETAKAQERSIEIERAKRDVQSEFIRRVSQL